MLENVNINNYETYQALVGKLIESFNCHIFLVDTPDIILYLFQHKSYVTWQTSKLCSDAEVMFFCCEDVTSLSVEVSESSWRWLQCTISQYCHNYCPTIRSMGGYLVYCVFFFGTVTDFSLVEKDGVKFCMRVPLPSGQVFSHFGELWLAESHGGGITSGMYADGNWMKAAAPSEAQCGSRNWGRRRCLRPYGGICVLQACWRTCFILSLLDIGITEPT